MSEAKIVSIPLYQKVREHLITQIESGVWRAAGPALPNEFKLAEELGVSQGTVRKALIELEKSGVVERVQGKGTFVKANTPERALFHFFRLSDESGKRVIPSTKLIAIGLRCANSNEAKLFNLSATNLNVVEIERVRLTDSTPIAHESIVVPAQLFDGLETYNELPGALYPFYQEVFHQSVLSAEENLKAVTVSSRLASALQVSTAQPLLSVERVALDMRGRPIELRTSVFLTDEYVYNIDLK